MQDYCKFVNEPLPYSYKAMEPYIDIQTMYLHHDKHLQAYIDKLNKIIRECAVLQAMTFTDKPSCGFDVLKQILTSLDAVPANLRTAVKDNAGGIFNHWFYFNGLSKQPEENPQGTLAESIHWQFGGFDQFQSSMRRLSKRAERAE